MTKYRMGVNRNQDSQASMSSIDDLIQDCYRLERLGKMDLALQHGIEAERLARSLEENDLVASALSAQAIVQAHLGHYSKARNMAEEALSIASPKALGRAEATIILGICASETDDLDTAEAHYQSAVDLCREIGNYQNLVRALHNLACGIYYPRGQFNLAIVTEQEVLQIANQFGITIYQEYAWTAQALVYLATGDYLQAEEALNNLQRLMHPDSRMVGYLHCLKAHLYQGRGEDESASDHYTQALTVAETVGDPGLNIETRWGLSRFYRMRGDFPAAYPWAESAVNIASHSGYHHVEGRALIERGRVAWEMNNWQAARNDFLAAIQRLEPLKANYDLCTARLMLASLMQQIPKDQIEFEKITLSEEKLQQYWILAAQTIVDNGYGFILEKEWSLAFPLVTSYLNDANLQASKLASRALAILQHSPSPLQIFTLGRFDVHQANRQIPDGDWRQRQAGELFRLLLISPGRRLTRDQVIEALWPDKTNEAAKASFHQTTSALRRTLEPELPDKFPSRYLLLEERAVTLRLPPGSQVDFEKFERCIAQGDLKSALSLFEGEPFPLDIYHDWVASKREQLNQQFLQTLLKVAKQQLQDSDFQNALESCRRLLSIDPWQEHAVMVGMHACISMKDRIGAIRLYKELERCLKEDLDIDPDSEIKQLYQSLL